MLKIIFSAPIIFYLFSGACSVIPKLTHDPCRNEAFLKDLSTLEQSELKKLARILEASSYAVEQKSGCKAALLARIYETLGRLSKASDYLAVAAKKLPQLSEYFLLAKASIELKQNRLDDASKIAKALLSSQAAHLSPQFALRVRHILAQIAVQRKDDLQIIKTHRDLISQGFHENEVLLFNLARALTNLGEHNKANEIFKKLLINFPGSVGSEYAEQMGALARFNLDQKEVEKRFDKLIEKLGFEKIIKDFDALLKKSSNNEERKSQLNSLAVKALLINNQFERGVNRGQALVRKKNPTARDYETYAFSLAKVDRFIDAAEYYGKSFKAAVNKEDQARACFFHGFSLYEGNLYAMALFAWQSCQKAVQDSTYYENYLWYQAFVSMLSGSHDKAHGILNKVHMTFPQSQETEKYQFFLGYTLQQLNKRAEANAYFLRLSEKAEISYYALLARRTLGQKNFRGAKISDDALFRKKNVKNDHSEKNAELLHFLGFKDDARELIVHSTLAPHDKLALLQRLGFYHDAWKQAPQLGARVDLRNGKLKANPDLRASFPLPYQTLINKFSNRYRVSPSLLYAIMQIESGFSEVALSPRGALGLMQMMPYVAKELAPHLGITDFSEEALKRPEISIELGALLLAVLQRQFNDPHLVVAAYNAGTHQVQKWEDRFGDLPIELYVERLPFQQTRNYVKKVVRSESLYNAMNGNEVRLGIFEARK